MAVPSDGSYGVAKVSHAHPLLLLVLWMLCADERILTHALLAGLDLLVPCDLPQWHLPHCAGSVVVSLLSPHAAGDREGAGSGARCCPELHSVT